jgi:hypothetical protein
MAESSSVRDDTAPDGYLEEPVMNASHDSPRPAGYGGYFEGLASTPNIGNMLRITHGNQAQLSAMADQKANIVLGASFVGLTLLVGRLGAGITPSLVVLSVFTLASALFALLTVMPSLPSRVRIDPTSPGFNPLFFGFSSRMDPDDYMKHMREIMDDDARVIETVLRDIHQAGTVLYHQKYRYLGYSYRLLMLGLVLSMATVGIEWAFGFGGGE